MGDKMKFSFTFNYLHLINETIESGIDPAIHLLRIDTIFAITPLSEVMAVFHLITHRNYHEYICLRWFQLIGLEYPKINLKRLAKNKSMLHSITLIEQFHQIKNPFKICDTSYYVNGSTKIDQLNMIRSELIKLILQSASAKAA
jgi:hypothetical protein